MSSTYICIDLKSFYASVECHARNLDPLTTNLVVADESRTEKTICLAVSPSLKALGIPGRARLFEVNQAVREYKHKTGVDVEFIIACPRMQKYMDVSSQIYNVYLRYISANDIHVYSIDEVFMDVTDYLALYKMTAKELAEKMIADVFKETGITATAGIGTNLYLAKIAMDIVAKHIEADDQGVRIATLDEEHYRRYLWDYKPITSFWRIGRGLAKRLEEHGIYTMGDIARISLLKDVGDPYSYKEGYRSHGIVTSGEDFLFKMFGIDAELLIDHAWGVETTTMADIKKYRPSVNSVSSGQVLGCSYPKEKAKLVVREMVDQLTLDLVAKNLVTNQIVLDIGYDKNLPEKVQYKGPMATDHFGRNIPKPAHGTVRMEHHTSSTALLTDAAMELYDKIVDARLQVHRLTVTYGDVIDEKQAKQNEYVQLDLFTDPKELEQKNEYLEKEKKLQQAMLSIKGKYGKNAILKGTNLMDGATAMERNAQIGGHKA